MSDSPSLTKAQARELANKIKSAVISAANNIQQAGQWLIEFRDAEGWMRLGYDSWTDCIKKEFTTTHGGRAHIFRLIQNFEVMENISENSEISFVNHSESTNGSRPRATFDPLPTQQTREIARVEPEKQAETFKRAAEIGNGHPTTKSVKQAVDEAIKKAKPIKEIHRDDTGYAIPDEILPLWNRREEVKEIQRAIATALRMVKSAHEKPDPLWQGVGMQSIAIALNNAKRDLDLAHPYAVCCACQGRATENCTACKGRGFISKHHFDSCVPEEFKAIRSKSCAQ